MQGRQGQGNNGKNPPHRSTNGIPRVSERVEQYRATGGTGAYRFSELTGQQRAIPKRPSGMSRVARPQEERRERKPKSATWWACASVIVILALLVIGGIAYGATNLFLAISVNGGAASTAGDFLANLQSANYDQAFSDLATRQDLSQSSFKQVALADDHCYGQITGSSEIDGSAVTGADGSQSYTYNITRSKLTKPYQMQLTLQKDAGGDWKITSYGSDLGPAPPTCK